MKVGLVLEGGGMRGFYTMGALDYLMEQGILFDYVIGVSAGAVTVFLTFQIKLNEVIVLIQIT